MRGNKDFKTGDKLVQGVGALKRGRLEPPLQTKGGVEVGEGVGV